MIWRPSEEENKYLQLVLSMTTDCVMGKGTDTVETYVMNLRNIAKCIEVLANKPIETTSTSCSCEPGQGGPCSFCMETKYNL